MRLVYLDDEDGCAIAQSALLAEFTDWYAGHVPTGTDRVAHTAADAAFTYKADTDGLLGRWTGDNVRDVMVDWMPRKTILPAADRRAVPPGLHAWVDFMAEQGPFDGRSDPIDALHAAIDAHADRFFASMADPGSYDTAKFWMTAMREHGVDLTDERARDRFRADVRSGRLDIDPAIPERANRRQADRATARPGPRFPPVSIPVHADLVAAAARPRAVGLFARLVDWLDGGRPLTGSGAPADVDALAETLGTAERGPGCPLTATELLAWARAMRLVRPLHAHAVPVKRAVRLMRDRPLRFWELALRTLLDQGGRFITCAPPGHELTPTVLPILTALYRESAAVPRALLHGLVEPDGPAGRYEPDLLLDVLELLGVLDGEAPADPELIEELTDLAGDGPVDTRSCALTPLGVRATNEILRAGGAIAPLAEELADETAEVLIAALSDADEAARHASVTAWRATRDERAVTDELTALIERTDDPDHRLLAERLLTARGSNDPMTQPGAMSTNRL